MIRTTRSLFAVALVATALAGCGGSGSSSLLPSLYRGGWTGTWTSPTNNEGGPMTSTITADGSLSGSMTRADATAGNLGGVINKSGQITATTSFPSSGNYVITGSGTLSNGHLVGSFSYTWLGSTYQGSFDMTPATAGGG